MDQAGLIVLSRFDAYDALENKEDLEILYEVLTSVEDKNGRPGVFTPFALPANTDFEKMAETNYQDFHYELLPETFTKLKGYDGTWDLWRDGIRQGLLAPQFHGREHFNLKVFEEKLAKKDHEVMTVLKNRSYTSISQTGYPTISYTAAYAFWDFRENDRLKGIIRDGLVAFEKVFGYKANCFTPPATQAHPVLHQVLREGGIRFLDAPLIKKEHQNRGRYTHTFHYTGKKNQLGQTYLVRNCVFEPTDDRGVDWVAYTLQQIEAAFRWNRPAIISSHRVNFCGHIDPKNRKTGIEALRKLLKEIIKRWPDVEFMSASELGELIEKSKAP